MKNNDVLALAAMGLLAYLVSKKLEDNKAEREQELEVERLRLEHRKLTEQSDRLLPR